MKDAQLNWLLCPCRNGLHLTRAALQTFYSQDIGNVAVMLIDNSEEGNTRWLPRDNKTVLLTCHSRPSRSVAESWNTGLRWIFAGGANHALVVNNDVELRPDTYRHLLADGGEFVTAVGVREKEKLGTEAFITADKSRSAMLYPLPDPSLKRPHPDFSCFLIRRSAWDRVGPFDENFKIAFCEDWDYHVRLHRAGITACALDLPFLHHASQTVKLADDAEARTIQRQADLNRAYFRRKWGVDGGTDAYYALFGHPAPQEAA